MQKEWDSKSLMEKLERTIPHPTNSSPKKLLTGLFTNTLKPALNLSALHSFPMISKPYAREKL